MKKHKTHRRKKGLHDLVITGKNVKVHKTATVHVKGHMRNGKHVKAHTRHRAK